ncbi:MAG: hypothetical protein KIS72_11255, partial [Luteimonas sp.]|nr:hypothetical protein [Luteimonas sp.]
GVYIVLMATETGPVILEPESRRTAVLGFEHDWARIGERVFRNIRLVPAWHVKPTEVQLLAGTVTSQSIREARRKLRPAAARRAIWPAMRPIAANDDSLIPPSRQAKRRPPDYDALLETSDRRRGPKCKWVEHLALMEERAGQGRLEATLAAEVRTLIRIGLARNFTHKPHLKTLQNALGRHYKKFRLKKSS